MPAAIQFQEDHDWNDVRRHCHDLVRQAIHRIGALTGIASVYPEEDGTFHQMAIAPLPINADAEVLKSRLYDDYRIEIPVIEWEGRHYIRLSIQGYNSQDDVDALLLALARIL